MPCCWSGPMAETPSASCTPQKAHNLRYAEMLRTLTKRVRSILFFKAYLAQTFPTQTSSTKKVPASSRDLISIESLITTTRGVGDRDSRCLPRSDLGRLSSADQVVHCGCPVRFVPSDRNQIDRCVDLIARSAVRPVHLAGGFFPYRLPSVFPPMSATRSALAVRFKISCS